MIDTLFNALLGIAGKAAKLLDLVKTIVESIRGLLPLG